MILAAKTLCEHYDLPRPTRNAVLEATGAGRSRAYELRDALLAVLPMLRREPGRPKALSSTPPTPSDAVSEIRAALLNHVLQHPGCAHRGNTRATYTDVYRRRVVELRSAYTHLTLEQFANAVLIPVPTLKAWFPTAGARSPARAKGNEESDSAACVALAGESPETSQGLREDDGAALPGPAMAHIETVATAWQQWQGTFGAFVGHIRENLRVPMGAQLISRILQTCGLRTPQRRGGRSADELALRGAFETFFPGAQWVGDGKRVEVTLDGQSFGFNLELDVDAASGALVGLSVRDEEDSEAVTESFEHGVETTGNAPLALLLDNKPANHTPQVEKALDAAGTLKVAATIGRPQNKAHVEGAFGLFAQQVPPIDLNTHGRSARETAHALMLLVATIWAMATNARPRRTRAGLSRVEIYQQAQPTEEQIRQAKAALRERARQQEEARRTREARQRPEVRALLDARFEQWSLSDPDGRQRSAIARYPMDSVADGLAIFDAKRRAATLPPGVDGRYLLGIVRNIEAKREGQCLTESLLEVRLQARDIALAQLLRRRELLYRSADGDKEQIAAYVREALSTSRTIDRCFWLRTAAELIESTGGQAHPTATALYRTAAAHIHTTFSVPPGEREDALRFLARHLVPLD